MTDIAIKITNLPQIRAAFSKAPNSMTEELNIAIKKTLLTIQAGESLEYRDLGIHVITGGLINSIRRGIYFGNLRGEVGPNVTGSPGVDYAGYVHDGTSRMKKRPFLLNSVDKSKNNTETFFINAVQNVLNKIAGSV